MYSTFLDISPLEAMQGSYSRAERGAETEADPFSTPEVLVFKAGK